MNGPAPAPSVGRCERCRRPIGPGESTWDLYLPGWREVCDGCVRDYDAMVLRGEREKEPAP